MVIREKIEHKSSIVLEYNINSKITQKFLVFEINLISKNRFVISEINCGSSKTESPIVLYYSILNRCQFTLLRYFWDKYIYWGKLPRQLYW